MTKTELATAVAEKMNSSKAEALKAIDAVFGAVGDALEDGEKLQVVGFGVFEVKERAARQGRNPRTGETVTIPASKVPVFKAGKPLKDKVNK